MTNNGICNVLHGVCCGWGQEFSPDEETWDHPDDVPLEVMTIPESKLVQWQQITDAAIKATIYGDVGPWKVGEPRQEGEILKVLDSGGCDVAEVGSPSWWMCPGACGPECAEHRDEDRAIGAFIAEARSMVPHLLDEVRRLRKLVNVMGGGLDVVSVCGGES